MTVVSLPARSWQLEREALTSRGTRAHLRVEEEDLLRLGLCLAVERIGKGGREQQWLARLWVRLDQHASQRHVADNAAETVREGSAGTQDRDTDNGLGLASLTNR